ncbi:MAG: hypothetical protein ACFFCI_01055 [Promethearchaeota archaeon]
MSLKLLKRKLRIKRQFAYFEYLGGHIYYYNQNLAGKQINELTMILNQQYESASQRIEKIRQNLCTNFGIVDIVNYPETDLWDPLPKPPFGKIYYLDWVKEIKKKYNKSAYKNLICSGCPYSKGVEWMNTFNEVPCELVNGALYLLKKPYLCKFIDLYIEQKDPLFQQYPEKEFYEKIEKEHGKRALKRFTKKQRKLKRKFEKLNKSKEVK